MKKVLLSFVILCLLAISFTQLHSYFLNLKSLEIEVLSKTLSKKQINKIVAFSKSKEYLIYFVIPINILVKTIVTALILFIGCIVFNLKIQFKQLLKLSIKAEYIFLLPILYEIIYFKFILVNCSYSYIQEFSSLSVFNLIKDNKIDSWFVYLLQTLNVFEALYILCLVYLIGKEAQSFRAGLKIVGYSYVPAQLLWVTVVMFFTLNYS
jgi:hypothetical protein